MELNIQGMDIPSYTLESMFMRLPRMSIKFYSGVYCQRLSAPPLASRPLRSEAAPWRGFFHGRA